jgi:hypothetical protein
LRAELRRATGDAAGAIADAQRALALQPGDPGPLRALGESYLAAGEPARGRYYLELFLQAADIDPALGAEARTVRAELSR